jgi:hypothetical protein
MLLRDHLKILRELSRIGVDIRRHITLVSEKGGTSPGDMLAWLRAIPTGAGHTSFMEQLSRQGPDAGFADREGALGSDSSHHDPVTEQLLELVDEIDRVLSGVDEETRLEGLTFPSGVAGAIAALRSLPAGSDRQTVARTLAASRRGTIQG